MPSWSKLSNNLPQYDPIYISPLFYLNLSAFLFSKDNVLKIDTKFFISIFLLFNVLLCVLVWLCGRLIILSGDIKVNLGPWRKNQINVCQFVTETSITYLSMTIPDYFFWWHIIHEFDIICLSETYLDSSIFLDDDNLVIPGNNLICSDHPSSTKRGSVCLYCKSYLLLRFLSISYLKECVNFEFMIGNKSCTLLPLIVTQAGLKMSLKLSPIILKWHYKLWHRKVLF